MNWSDKRGPRKIYFTTECVGGVRFRGALSLKKQSPLEGSLHIMPGPLEHHKTRMWILGTTRAIIWS